MGNNSTILEPSVVHQAPASEDLQYLARENYLSEFANEDEKSVVRANLGVYSKDFVYTKDEAQLMVNEKIHTALRGYVSSDELPKAIAALSDEIASAGYVKSDGSVPFTNPQSQSSLPTQDYHLANKIYVDNLLTAHVNGNDPHNTLEQVKVLLADYAKLSDTYTSVYLYTKKEIDQILSGYVKRDGSVGFTKPQVGVDPELPSHLATARYVQLVMQNHKCEQDPHDMLATIKRYLSNYYTKSETYTKAQTYSRAQLLDIIKDQMKDIVEQAIATHVANDGSVSELKDYILNKLYNCIRADGSIAHTKPQAGVAAEHSNEFVVLEQLTTAIETLSTTLHNTIKEATNQSTWIPSGPVRSTVGFVEDNMHMPREMTVQQICDAIFYGRQIGVVAPPFAEYGEQVCIKIFTHGIGILEEVEIYKNGELIGTLTAEDFKLSAEDFRDDGAYYEYCDTGEFTQDTEWRAEFHYSDGQSITDTATTRLSYPIFIGAVPYWWNAQEDITMDSLRELATEDPINCRFFTHHGPEISKMKTKFSFVDVKQRSIVVVIPNDYPDLLKMITPTQEVEAPAFAKWLQPMYPNNVETGVLYKIYVFNQPLVKLDQTVKFHFGEQTEDYDE